jgi:hypothetical protein
MFVLLILQSFDWLADFRLQLLQAILSIAVQLSAAVFLATCFNTAVQVFPRPFFQIFLLQGCLL